MQKKLIIIGIAILGIVFSCTKLDQQPFHVLPGEKYTPTNAEIGIGYVSPVYSLLHAITGSNQAYSLGDPYQGQSFCTDEALTPHAEAIGMTEAIFKNYLHIHGFLQHPI